VFFDLLQRQFWPRAGLRLPRASRLPPQRLPADAKADRMGYGDSPPLLFPVMHSWVTITFLLLRQRHENSRQAVQEFPPEPARRHGVPFFLSSLPTSRRLCACADMTSLAFVCSGVCRWRHRARNSSITGATGFIFLLDLAAIRRFCEKIPRQQTWDLFSPRIFWLPLFIFSFFLASGEKKSASFRPPFSCRFFLFSVWSDAGF